MDCCKCECDCGVITVIKGDVLEVYFHVKGIECDSIVCAYFSCGTLGISTELPYSKIESGYCLRLVGEITKDLFPGFYSYDFTLKLINGEYVTLKHNGEFIVLKKRNKLCEDVEGE